MGPRGENFQSEELWCRAVHIKKKAATANSLTHLCTFGRESSYLFSEAVSFINPHRRRRLALRVYLCVFYVSDASERSHTDGMLRATAAAALMELNLNAFSWAAEWEEKAACTWWFAKWAPLSQKEKSTAHGTCILRNCRFCCRGREKNAVRNCRTGKNFILQNYFRRFGEVVYIN